MTAVEPCDEENPTLADIARAVNQVHSCVDGLRAEHAQRWAEQARVNDDAKVKRHNMANAVTGLTGALKKVETEVGGLKAQQEIDGARISKLARAFGTEQPSPGEKPVKVKTIAGWKGWQALAALFSSLGGLVLAYKIASNFAPAALRAFHHAVLAAQ